jgi:hypothetical protein
MPAPISSLKNQYPGINAHLNSALQARNRWETFHSHHISDLESVLNSALVGMGYTAELEDGLQIRRHSEPPRAPEADVLIWQDQPRSSTISPAPLSLVADARPITAMDVVTVPEKYNANSYHKAVVVYPSDPDQQRRPIAWIELLSSSNKPGGSHCRVYRDKRDQLLEAETVVFIEIDYLHAQAPTLRTLPDYTRAEAGSSPYHIALIETRRGIRAGEGFLLEFGVEDAIPPFTIPLVEDDSVLLDLGAAYKQTFERALYGQRDEVAPDYAADPPAIHCYTPSDQEKIKAWIGGIQQAVADGIELDTINTPLEIPT